MLRNYFYSFATMLLVFSSINNVAASSKKQETTSEYNKDNDFLELSEPERKVSGAYYGLGVTLSRTSNKLNISKNQQTSVKYDNSANQYDLSAIVGFGSAFYERYYAGVELDFFKRLPEKTKRKDEIGIIHASNIGMNMDVRFGYQFPQYGTLGYVTVGFARIIGKTAFYRSNDNNPSAKKSFGSFYPTLGFGLEYKMNHKWNLRGDFRYSITNKDDNKYEKLDANEWNFDAKPNRFAIRFSVTRNI